MKTDKPLVSVGVTLYNATVYMREALDSLMSQDYENIEFIISDNASTDDTNAVCQEYLDTRENITLVRQDTNIGASRNGEYVMRQATGKYYMWAAYDDVWEPGFVSACVQALESNPRAILAYPATVYISPEGEKVDRPGEDIHTVGLSPVERYIQVARTLNRCVAFYGLWRRDTLLDTEFGSNVGSDVLFMLKKSLDGEFIYLGDKPFFYNRVFPGRDVEYYTTLLDPTNKTRYWRSRFPFSELLYLMLRMVARMDLAPAERARLVLPTLMVCKRFFGLSFLKEVGLDRTYLRLLKLAGQKP